MPAQRRLVRPVALAAILLASAPCVLAVPVTPDADPALLASQAR